MQRRTVGDREKDKRSILTAKTNCSTRRVLVELYNDECRLVQQKERERERERERGKKRET